MKKSYKSFRKKFRREALVKEHPIVVKFFSVAVHVTNDTQEQRDFAPVTLSLEKPTKYRHFDLVKIENRKVQHKTRVRFVAESGPRNALSMHA
jgi:hypothetical protein